MTARDERLRRDAERGIGEAESDRRAAERVGLARLSETTQRWLERGQYRGER